MPLRRSTPFVLDCFFGKQPVYEMKPNSEVEFVTAARCAVLGVALAICALDLVLADDLRETNRTSSGITVPGTGTITGKVTYKSDPQRPWRLGRYYLQNPKSGELAEAVVAISLRGLKGPDVTREPRIVTIDQKDFQFTPETVAIRAGDQIKFTNSDAQVHNVQTNHLRQTFNVNMAAGGEHNERFGYAGGIRQPYRIGCAYHGAMRSWVFVFDHPWYGMTKADGAFRLDNVPAGDYRLEVAHPAGDLKSGQAITVKAGESVTVEFQLSPDDLPKPKS